MTRKDSATRLIAGLAEHGYTMAGIVASAHILRSMGQANMNKAAGEAAPTWELRINPMWRFERVHRVGDRPTIRCPDGTTRIMEVCSHEPLLHILKYPASQWSVGIDGVFQDRLTVYAPELPPTW